MTSQIHKFTNSQHALLFIPLARPGAFLAVRYTLRACFCKPTSLQRRSAAQRKPRALVKPLHQSASRTFARLTSHDARSPPPLCEACGCCRQCLAARRRRFLVADAGGRTEPTRRRRTGCPRARRCLLGALQARVGRARCSTLALAGREPRASGTPPAPASPSPARGDVVAARGRPGC